MFVSPSPIPGMLRRPKVRPGREAPTTLGLEAKSLKNGMTHHWNFQGPKQTNKPLYYGPRPLEKSHFTL